MLTLVLSALFFLGLYALVAGITASRTDDFNLRFKLLRGLASVLLTAIGFYALVHWQEFWRQCYMTRHTGDVLAYTLVLFITGHFLADFLLLGYGWVRHREKPRPDLVVHHLLGVFASWVVMHYDIGHALYLLMMTAEMMPVTSGVAALGALLQRPRMEQLGSELRLAALVLWRMPMWFVVGYLCLQSLEHPAEPILVIGYRFSLAFLVLTFSLDSYWIVQCIKALQRIYARAVVSTEQTRSPTPAPGTRPE